MRMHAVLAALLIAPPASAQQSLAARCAAMALEGNVAACERAIAENPQDDESRRHLGRAFLAVGDGVMSVRTYRDLLTRHPDDWTLHFDLAVATTASS
jgi:Flp pilus assembly protein TadD